MNIGTSVRVGLAKTNIKGKDLATEMGTSPSYISAICNNHKVPSMERVEFLANYFKVKASEFISWGEPN